MGYTVPTLPESEDLLVAVFKAQFPDRNVGAKRAYHRRRLKVIASALTELHYGIASVQDDVMPDRATLRAGTLLRWCDIFGVVRKGATGSRKGNALRVRGDLASIQAISSTLTHQPSGLVFALDEQVTIPAGLFFDADVYAVSTGSRTRLEAGEQLTFDNPATGIETIAELQLALDEDGFDQEPEGSLRRRMLATIAEPQSGGNDADHVRWAESVTGVDRAYPYSNRAGIGSVDVVGLHVGADVRGLNFTERSVLLAYLKTKEPSQLGGSGGDLRVLTTVEDKQRVEMRVQTDEPWDWDDSVPPVVNTIDAPNRKISFTLPRPTSMLAGHRLAIRGVASTQTGAPLVIESTGGLVDLYSITLQVWPSTNPANTDIVYAQNATSAIVRQAIVDHLNGEILYADDGVPVAESVADAEGTTLLLNVLAMGIGPANPGGIYGAWSGDIVRAVLFKIATYVAGVRNATTEVPAADYLVADYAFPNDASIPLVVPGEVLVRKAAV